MISTLWLLLDSLVLGLTAFVSFMACLLSALVTIGSMAQGRAGLVRMAEVCGLGWFALLIVWLDPGTLLRLLALFGIAAALLWLYRDMALTGNRSEPA